MTYQHRTFPSSSKVHHLLTPQSQPNPENFGHADEDSDNGTDIKDENDNDDRATAPPRMIMTKKSASGLGLYYGDNIHRLR